MNDLLSQISLPETSHTNTEVTCTSKTPSKKKVKEISQRDILLDAFNLHVQKLRNSFIPQDSVQGSTPKHQDVVDLHGENEISTEPSLELTNNVDEHMDFEASAARIKSSSSSSDSNSDRNISINVNSHSVMNTVEMSALASTAISSSSSSSSKLTRKQMLSNAALEKRRVQRRLSNQSNGEDDPEPVTDAMVNGAILTSGLDRIFSLFSRQYKPAPTQVWAKERNAKGDGKPVKFPLVPSKKQVGWLEASHQDLEFQSLPISDELVLFAKYVSVSVHLCCFIVAISVVYD